MTPSSTAQFNFHIPVSPLLLFTILALVILAWCIITLVIRYHWKSYGTGKLEVFTMNFFYLAGSVVLIILLSAFALLYSLSK